MKWSWWLAILIVAAALPTWAGDTLSLRQIEASNESKGMADGLADVADLLKRNMSFSNYQLLDSKALSLPADGAVNLQKNFQVKCKGKQDSLTVTVSQNKTELLRTTVSLRDRKPLILGSFPSKNNQIILVLMAK